MSLTGGSHLNQSGVLEFYGTTTNLASPTLGVLLITAELNGAVVIQSETKSLGALRLKILDLAELGLGKNELHVLYSIGSFTLSEPVGFKREFSNDDFGWHAGISCEDSAGRWKIDAHYKPYILSEYKARFPAETIPSDGNPISKNRVF